MIDNINKLLDIIHKNNFIKVNDNDDSFILSFIYDNSYDPNNFINEIINIISIFPSSLNQLTTINNFPSLKSNFSDISDAKERILEHISKHIKNKTKNIVYNINLKKSLLIYNSNCNISCYWNLSDFISLLKHPFENINKMNVLFSTSYYNIIVIVNETNIFLNNNTTLIVSPDKFPNSHNFIIPNTENLNKKIEFKEHHCNIEFPTKNIIPDFFIFDYNNSTFIYNNELKLILNNLFALFYLLFISNSAKIENDQLKITIFSTKNITIIFDTIVNINQVSNYSSLLELYYICYNSLNLENLYIIRNMYVVYLDSHINENLSFIFFDKSKEVLDSVKSNINILTIGNVEKYFSIRYSLFEFLDKNILDIQNKISNIIQNMNKTFLGTIAALATTSFIYFKDRNRTVLKLSILLYTIYLIIDLIYFFTSQRKAFNVQQKQYNNKIDYFKPIIGPSEFNNILEKCEKNDKLKSSFNWYFRSTLVLHVLLITAGFLSFFCLNWILNFFKWILSFTN